MSIEVGPQIVLASASPRRKQLLQQIGVACRVVVSDVDETPYENEVPGDFVLRMALEKARAVTDKYLPVLAADTVVVHGGVMMGKPKDQSDAMAMLQRLQGACHEVMTSVAICWQGKEFFATSDTKVCFDRLSPEQCEAYWRTGEPKDKAGSYAIQGIGAMFITRIEGSYSGVMGLPLYETAQLLQQVGIASLLPADDRMLQN